MAEDLPLLAGKTAATLAMSLLDKAFSYLGGKSEQDYKEELSQSVRRILTILDEAERRLIKWRLPSLDLSILGFRRSVEEVEDAIDEIDYRRLEESAVRSPISKLVRRKIASKIARFIPDSNLGRLREAVVRLDHMASVVYRHYQRSVARRAPGDAASPASEHERYPSWIAAEGVVGRDKEKEQIMRWLRKHPSEDPEIVRDNPLSVFAIVGMAGMGKSALAKLIHDDPQVSADFDLVVWVRVCTEFSAAAVTSDVLNLIAAAAPGCSSMEFMQRCLAEKLRDKKLLLILDDVWEDGSMENWGTLVAPLRSAKRGSKILLTTRMQSVADMAAAVVEGEAECLKLDELHESDSFLLFKSLLNSDVNSEDYANLLLIGEQIAKKFGACPFLTLAVISHLRNDLKTSWSTILQQDWHQIEGIYSILPSLKLSYNHLPAQLQVCFRYCSIFPRGHKFYKEELVNMWVGSGLIPFASWKPGDFGLERTENVGHLNPVDVGRQCFTALTRKSFFCRMLETDACNGDQKEYYALHSLMHDLAQLVSHGECARVDNGGFQNVMSTTRHLSIAHCGNLTDDIARKIKSLRTLIIQSEFCLDQQTELLLGEILESTKCLRLLQLAVPSPLHVLDRVSNLIHLRYISLLSCDESHLHRVFKLYHLQVLKLSYLTVKEADLSGIYNLRSLRCLHIPDNMSSRIHKFGRLTSLQDLHGFEVLENDGSRLSTLSNLRSLCRLGLINLQNVKNYKEAMEVKLKENHDMRFLSFSWNRHLNDSEKIDERIINNLEPNREIQILRIQGYNGSVLPFWIENSLLVNLVSLELDYCIKWKNLPSLQELNLLKYLKLDHLFQLEYIGVVPDGQTDTNESGNVCLPPFLQTLIIRWCPSLRKLPTIPLSLELLTIKHVGLTVLPGMHERKSMTSSVRSDLAFLHIQSCAHLTSLDKGLLEHQEHFHALTTLVIRHCESLCHLPRNGFAALHHLKFLEIVACPMLRDVTTEDNILPSSLENLDVNPCGSIKVSMLMSLRNLTFLNKLTLFSCSNLEKLPSEKVFGTLQVLRDMSVARCKALLSLGGLGAVASLRMLSILYCDKLNLPCSPQVGCSFMLQELKIDRRALLFGEPLRSLRHTKELYICNDCEMESLPEEWLLQNAASLHSIGIGIAESLRFLPSQMEKLENLQSLHIERAPLMQLLPQLPTSLSKLTIWGCDPVFLKWYEKDVGPNWGKIAHIAHVDMKAYSEGMNSSDDQIQGFDKSARSSCHQFVVI